MDHSYGDYNQLVKKRIQLLPIGGRMKDLPQELWHKSYLRVGEKKTGGPNLRLLRLDPEKPSNTITAYVFNKFVHPTEDRYITPREAARIQCFPDEFKFAGTLGQIQLQIGNAVPVKLAEAVAKHMSEYLKSQTKKNTFNSVSLFAGAGGMDLGFHKYFNIVSINEYIPVFCETLRKNFKDSNVVEASILDLKGKDLSGTKEIDFIFGGPPCQAFSAAGKQRGIEDPRGVMIHEYVRMVEELKPEAFVLENVPGLKAINKGKTLQYTLDLIDKAGYKAEWYILNAAEYGAPQARRRLFILGRKKKYRKPIGMPPITNSAKPDLFGLEPYVGVGEALKGLPKAVQRQKISI
ncbi:DNA cytosine methyltransferase [Candidatus Saccharibacteria bacterium]|nr:DNA cytosine methyltransferase [Candidatus Saccharibacteria bacterium]